MSAVKFKLDLNLKPSSNTIQYQHKTLLIGSCFTENMGAKLQHHLFDTFENPHGILFNPVSVQNALTDYISNKEYTASDLFLLNEVWNSWHHHSRFSGITQQVALDKINTSIQKAHSYLKTANQLVITLGSAWLYELTDQAPGMPGLVVANNHKAPANWFTKRLLKPTELLKNLQELTQMLISFNPNLQIIFTISPVRHLREGLVENNRSKAVLIQAVHDLVESTKQAAYFPAYELVIDDLRDYRFYAEDLVHPNYAATTYVWEKFVSSYMTSETQIIMKQVAELQLAMNHKPFFEGSSEHQKFLHNCLDKTEQLQRQCPYLPLQNHLQFFKSQIGK
jgi:hypothetical protein